MLLTRISTVNGVLFRKDSALGYLRSSFTQKGILPTHSRAHLYTSTPAGPPANQTRQHRHPRRRFSPISLQAPTPNVHLLFGLIYFNAPNNRIPLLTSFSLHCHSAACAFGGLFRVIVNFDTLHSTRKATTLEREIATAIKTLVRSCCVLSR